MNWCSDSDEASVTSTVEGVTVEFDVCCACILLCGYGCIESYLSSAAVNVKSYYVCDGVVSISERSSERSVVYVGSFHSCTDLIKADANVAG